MMAHFGLVRRVGVRTGGGRAGLRPGGHRCEHGGDQCCSKLMLHQISRPSAMTGDRETDHRPRRSIFASSRSLAAAHVRNHIEVGVEPDSGAHMRQRSAAAAMRASRPRRRLGGRALHRDDELLLRASEPLTHPARFSRRCHRIIGGSSPQHMAPLNVILGVFRDAAQLLGLEAPKANSSLSHCCAPPPELCWCHIADGGCDNDRSRPNFHSRGDCLLTSLLDWCRHQAFI